MAGGEVRPQRPRRWKISWPGLVVSQVMVVFGTWLVNEWDVGLWWTIASMSFDTGYAVTNLHPPYREPAIQLAIGYAVWFLGMVLFKFGPAWF